MSYSAQLTEATSDFAKETPKTFQKRFAELAKKNGDKGLKITYTRAEKSLPRSWDGGILIEGKAEKPNGLWTVDFSVSVKWVTDRDGFTEVSGFMNTKRTGGYDMPVAARGKTIDDVFRRFSEEIGSQLRIPDAEKSDQ